MRRHGKAVMRAVSVLFTLALILFGMAANLPAQVYADEEDAAFTYHVTVSGGLHGTVDGSDQVEVQIAPGGQFNPNDYTVALNDGDDKYYFKGFHVSGIEGVLEGAQTINEDKVFVATYGVKGDLVEYTVHYVDENGNQLLPSGTFYGNPGDKPVIAYQYVEGYLPQAYNLTGTLTENGPNEFTFVYSVNENAAGTAETAQNAEGSAAGQTGTAGTGAGAGAAGGENGPAQIIDLDDEAAPQTDGDSSADGDSDAEDDEEIIADDEAPQSEGKGMSMGAMIGAIVGGAAGIGFLAWLIAFLRKKAASGSEQ